MAQTPEAHTKNRIKQLEEVLRQSVLIWEKPVFAAVLTGLIFVVITALFKNSWQLSVFGYYNYLADAFLHGQLYLRELPVSTKDLSFFQGQYYLYWGPLPAVILMPFVAIFGIGFSDILQTLVVGAMNVGIFALLLQRAEQRGLLRLDPLKRSLLVIFFALGTAHAPLLPMGSVWRLAQLLTVTFALLAYLAALSLKNEKAFFWTGCALACVLATRMTGVFVAIFLAWFLLQQHWQAGFRRLSKYCLYGAAPVVVVALLLLLYNAARFGDPLDNGVSYHLMSDTFREAFTRYGLLNVHYIPANLYLNLLFYPLVTLIPPHLVPMGGSIFLLSPLYLAAVSAVWQYRKQPATWLLLSSVLVGSIPSLMVMAPGSVSLGPRYLLDIAPALLLLTAIGMQRWSRPWIVLFTALSVFQYIAGTCLMLPNWY